MSYHIDILAEVYTDLHEAYLWYENQQRGLGRRFTDSFRVTAVDLAWSPLGYIKLISIT